MSEVQGKVAIVTGGANGIGLEFVKLLQSKGCNVVIGDLQLTPEAQTLTETSGAAKVIFKQTDVSNWAELEELFSFTEREIGAPDIVCPGAGIFEPAWSHFWNDTESQSYQTVQVNIEHPVKATRLAIKSFLKANKPGVVVHLSSIAGQTTRLPLPIYCASKAFLNHFVRAFATLEAAESIKIFAVAPGMVRTPLWFKENPERLRSVGETDLWIEPSEIAEIMYDACVNPAIKGGTVIEASGQGRTRNVDVFNDPGPPGIGSSKGANEELEKDVFAMLKLERTSKL